MSPAMGSKTGAVISKKYFVPPINQVKLCGSDMCTRVENIYDRNVDAVTE